MKLELKKLVILALFLMIVLPSISQVRYIIDGDTLTAYTSDENRSIAKVMLEGERDSTLLVNCEDRVDLLLAKDSIRIKQIAELTKQIDMLDKSYLNCIEVADNIDDDRIKLKHRLTLGKIIIVALTVLLVIK